MIILVTKTSDQTRQRGHTLSFFSSHLFWTSSSLDVPAGVTQKEGHTRFLIHPPSAVRASTFLARRIQPFLSLVDREVEFCVCMFFVFSSHSFWTSSSLDVPAGVTQEEGHTGFLIHLLSAVRALFFLARMWRAPRTTMVDPKVSPKDWHSTNQFLDMPRACPP